MMFDEDRDEFVAAGSRGAEHKASETDEWDWIIDQDESLAPEDISQDKSRPLSGRLIDWFNRSHTPSELFGHDDARPEKADKRRS